MTKAIFLLLGTIQQNSATKLVELPEIYQLFNNNVMSLVPSKRIISICSDFGTQDYRLSSLKAEVLKSNPQISILDISHEVTPFDLTEAAFLVSNAIPHFPSLSIHVVWVFNTSEDQGIIVAKWNDQFIIAPDNGLIGLITSHDPELEIFRISDDCYSYKKRIADTVKILIDQEQLGSYFELMHNPVHKISLNPVYQKDRIQARVIYIDRYGNIIFNIKSEPFKEVCVGRNFSFNTPAHQIISNFNLQQLERENGAFYINFTDSGYLKLALCGAEASSTLDIKKDDTIQILFE
ncbi:MAG: SAM-dependent chlorinase/fluorinase [Saprospiraceae bacterium]